MDLEHIELGDQQMAEYYYIAKDRSFDTSDYVSDDNLSTVVCWDENSICANDPNDEFIYENNLDNEPMDADD